MILRTLDRAFVAGCFKSVVCATDAIRIFKTVEEAGYTAVLTGPAVTGSDRVSEAAEKLGLDLVVNLQGDEPVADLQMLRDVAKALAEEPNSWVSVAAPLADEDRDCLSVVKVEIDSTDHAVEFIRKLPPEPRKWFRHVGVYAYSAEARQELASHTKSAPDKEGYLGQLVRVCKGLVRMVRGRSVAGPVDLRADVQKVESILKQMEANQNGKSI